MRRKKNPFVLVVLDAQDGGVEKAKALSRRFIDEDGKTTDETTSRTINRRSSLQHVQKLTRKMVMGRWNDASLSSEFVRTKKGYLKQGRHRCLAFIEAAKVKPDLRVEFWMRTGIDDEKSYSIRADEKPESEADRWNSNGIDQKYAKHATIAKFILFKGCSPKNHIVTEDVRDAAFKWAKQILCVEGMLKGKEKVSSAPVVAAVTRALIATKKEAAIRRFCDILAGSIPDAKDAPWEQNAYLLRESILLNEGRSRGDIVDLYKVTQTGLQLFLEKAEPQEKIKPSKMELFLLPGDTVFDPAENPAFLVPVSGTPGRNISNTISAIMRGKIPLRGVRFTRIPRNAKICVFLPSRGRRCGEERNMLVATATFSKIQHNHEDDVPEMSVKNVAPISGNITPDKLFDLSVSHRKIPDIRRMAMEITKIHPQDIEILKR